MRETRARDGQGLRTAIERSGYYPALVADAVESALGAEPPVAYVVHHEAAFDPGMEVRRHATVLVLSPTRLLFCHTDEHPPSELVPQAHCSTTTEAVRLDRVGSVTVTRIVAAPENYRPGLPPAEVELTVRWGGASRIDLEPNTCGDENCDADHGYSGIVAGDDLFLRVSEAADGAEAVSQVLAFAAALSAVTTG
ncbi:DUF5998 family protein [Actinocorallia lasiicapitis]